MNLTILSARRSRLAAAGAAVAACAAMALAPVGAQAAVNCGPEADQAPTAKREYLAGSATRCLINNERQARGLAPLRYYISLRGSTYVNVLASAAYKHNQDMVTNHFLSHTGSDNSTPQTRMASYHPVEHQRDHLLGRHLPRHAARGRELVDEQPWPPRHHPQPQLPRVRKCGQSRDALGGPRRHLHHHVRRPLISADGTRNV